MDVVVTKLNASGSRLVYSTYIGGSLDDFGNGIGIDGSGSAYVVGRTFSTDYPVNGYDTTNSGSEAFVTKLAPDGTSLGYSTFLGVGSTQGFNIAVDSGGVASVVGQTLTSSFPTTTGAYDTTFNGGWDGFVTQLNSSGSGLNFSTFLGGGQSDCEVGGDFRECDIALGSDDSIYVTGPTGSSNFPTTGSAYDTTYNGSTDIFVARLSSDGSNLLYSTFLGGTGGDYCNGECSIAVDGSGNAYIAGSTYSTNFPASGGYNGGADIFVTELSADLSGLIFSRYLGTSGDDQAGDVDVVSGVAVVTGQTNSANFPTTTGAFQEEYGGGSRDAFVTRFSAGGSSLAYSSYLGGGGDELGRGLKARSVSAIYVTGWTASGDFPTTPYSYKPTGGGDIYATKLETSEGGSVPDPSTLSDCCEKSGNNSFEHDPRETDLSALSGTQGDYGDPINTRTGGLDYRAPDISVPTAAGPLVFERWYTSLTADDAGELGYGWTYNQDSRLIFPGDSGGETGFVLFKANSANIYHYAINPNGTYDPEPGVTGRLALQPGSPAIYTVTLPNQSVYTFDDEGQLQTWEDGKGHAWTYSYTGGYLTQVMDDSEERYLSIEYDEQDRIESVTDHTEREITYEYDTTGDLISVSDLRGGEWTYEYDSSHRLTDVINPDDVTVLQTDYDGQGRAIRQYDGLTHLIAELTYNQDGTVTLEDALGNETTHVYDIRNTLTNQTDALEQTTSTAYDGSFRPATITDPSDHSTSLSWSDDGANLLQVVDAAGGRTDIDYDALNNPVSVIDPLDYLTTFEYNGKLLTGTTDALNFETTYTNDENGYLKSVTDPLDHTTTFENDEYGNRISMTDPSDQTWTYTYDDLSRLTDTTDPLGHVTHNDYDDADRLVSVTRNYDPNRVQNEDNLYNIVTEYSIRPQRKPDCSDGYLRRDHPYILRRCQAAGGHRAKSDRPKHPDDGSACPGNR